MKRIIKFFGILVLLTAITLGGVAGYFYSDYRTWLNAPIDPGSDAVTAFAIAPGSSFAQVKKTLAEADLLNNPRYFDLHIRYYKLGGKIKAGQYDMPRNQSPAALIDKIVNGRVATVEVTIPEGLQVTEIVPRFVQAGILSPAEGTRMQAIALDPASPERYGFKAPSLEGYLYPETYRFARGVTAETVLKEMTGRVTALWSYAWLARAKELGMTPNQVMTLASIIEKETGVPEERPMISSVYHNRLRIGMRLQADPTVIYGVKNYNGNITRKHLETDHPYNTYTRKGLPPGPIASPGGDAIKAALWPATSKNLYFVSMNNGHHKFSTNYADHKKWVDLYQRRGVKAPSTP